MEKRFYVTADASGRRIYGYYVRYDAGAVFRYFYVDKKAKITATAALKSANDLRDEMNERENAKT